MKLNPNYYKPGVEHLCMFCGTPIGKLVDGRIVAIGSKAHVLFEKKNEGAYIINCCKNCAQDVDFKDPVVKKAVYHNVILAQESLDALRGKITNTISERKRRLADVPTSDGNVVVEPDVTERTNSLKRLEGK